MASHEANGGATQDMASRTVTIHEYQARWTLDFDVVAAERSAQQTDWFRPDETNPLTLCCGTSLARWESEKTNLRRRYENVKKS